MKPFLEAFRVLAVPAVPWAMGRWLQTGNEQDNTCHSAPCLSCTATIRPGGVLKFISSSIAPLFVGAGHSVSTQIYSEAYIPQQDSVYLIASGRTINIL
jgi:hypothetical protein